MLGLGSLRLAKGARMQPQSQASNDGGGRPDWKRELINEKPTFSFFGDEWPAAGFRTHASHDPRSSRRAEEGASRPLSQCNCSRTPRRPYGPRPGHSRAWLWQPQGTIATSPFAAASSEKLRWPWPPKISFLLLGLNFRILDGSARWIDIWWWMLTSMPPEAFGQKNSFSSVMCIETLSWASVRQFLVAPSCASQARLGANSKDLWP